MEMMLAENIRMYRKRKRLTQEQLAEDLGVTSGAVYKWEAKLSVPELNMIIVIADYFDTSVDALLGYTMKDNRLSVTVQRLKEYRIKKEYIGLAEAEKALKKFPHAFEVVHESAILYRVFGIPRPDRRCRRSCGIRLHHHPGPRRIRRLCRRGSCGDAPLRSGLCRRVLRERAGCKKGY